MVKSKACKPPAAAVLSALALAACFLLSAAVGAESGEPEADREFYSPPRRNAHIAPHARVKVAIPAVGAPSLVRGPAEVEPETSAIPYDAEPPALRQQPESPFPDESGAHSVPPRTRDAEAPDDRQAPSSGSRPDPSPSMAEDVRPPEARVLAAVDGREITDREILRELWSERGRDTFDWLVGRALLEAELAGLDLAVTEDEVDVRLREHLEGLREIFPDIRRDDDLTRAASGMGLAEYRKRSVWSELALRKIMRRTVVPDESALRAYYADWPAKARYIEPDMALAAQIFIAPAAGDGGASDAAEWAAAERRIIEAHSRLRMGEDFRAVASSYATGGYAPRWVGHGELMRELEDAAFSLKVGAMSGPIRSAMGYHIILVQDRKERREPPFEEVRDRVLAEYEEKLFVATAGEFMTRLRERAVKDGRLVLGADDLSFPDR